MQTAFYPASNVTSSLSFQTSLTISCRPFWASQVALVVKNLLPMQETRIGSLDRQDPLEEGIATHSSILAWRIPWTEEPGGMQSMGSQRVGRDRDDLAHTHRPFWVLFPLVLKPGLYIRFL